MEVVIYDHNYVPIEEWSNELAVYGKVKVDCDCSRKWKRGLNARLVLRTRPETQWATHGQVEDRVKPIRGPNR